ncbi:MAG TPA: hypothetical protein PLH72_07880 [Vicinamibacterales bacterium]|nr:hypothetical protein [Vicinamibacterales bacterium]
MRRRITITGIGVVSTCGLGRDAFWVNVRGGISGTRAITAFDASAFPCRVAAEVPVLPAGIEALAGENGQASRADPKRYSRAADFAVRAAVRPGTMRASRSGSARRGHHRLGRRRRRHRCGSTRTSSPGAVGT